MASATVIVPLTPSKLARQVVPSHQTFQFFKHEMSAPSHLPETLLWVTSTEPLTHIETFATATVSCWGVGSLAQQAVATPPQHGMQLMSIVVAIYATSTFCAAAGDNGSPTISAGG